MLREDLAKLARLDAALGLGLRLLLEAPQEAPGALAGHVRERRLAKFRQNEPVFGKISGKCCSFSAVSAPIFARKCAFCSIFQNLPDYQAEIFENWQNFANFATFAKFLLNFHENC